MADKRELLRNWFESRQIEVGLLDLDDTLCPTSQNFTRHLELFTSAVVEQTRPFRSKCMNGLQNSS